ncbi:alginate lyase family protein [Pseudonocardia hispaniensis]|uniref:Alginate lyase family protein n=1 Tax=Pseudonocardia hispaniensis TaxID=904933 RepID=A0ABW1J7Z4_9PSEU
MTDLGWYLRRLSRMGPREIVGRVETAVRVQRWRRMPPTRGGSPGPVPRRFAAVLAPSVLAAVPEAARARLLGTADRLMDGDAELLGHRRADLVSPDWSFDPRTGRRAPADAYAFDISYRDEQVVGDIKQIWELSRHQYLTVLAAAFALTGDERYATRVADHLKSWWAAHPPMRGVAWISGIELGIRLLSWVWVRRLLDGWRGAPGLFEDNPEALEQIWFHQRWLAAFPSRGSSANNHIIAESAGLLAAACAFGWFPESASWRVAAARSLVDHLGRNTFGSGLNRELATEYHGLVLELGLAAFAEADAAGMPMPERGWTVLARMTDALAAVLDVRGRPPRQGDGDDGYGLVLDGAGTDRWASLLATGAAVFGRADWWPESPVADVRTPLLMGLLRPRPPRTDRPARRPSHFADAGMTILRVPRSDGDGEIWCRCDGGPHGFGSIAAHAHADALSVEVRQDGVDVLADPGCYCYHGQPQWRAFFRSTLGHNTIELDGADQSRSGGPFLWTRHARSRVLAVDLDESGVSRWGAEHEGYRRPGRRVVHRRWVELDAATRTLRVSDELHTRRRHRCRLVYHLGPRVAAELDGARARLSWTHRGVDHAAVLDLPPELVWSRHRGELDPPLGWYSAGFGRKEPAVTLVGSGRVGPHGPVLRTLLRLGPDAPVGRSR